MTEWKFRRISVGDGDQKHYFAMLRLHENASDFEASTIDLNVTLEQKTWKAEGLTRPKGGAQDEVFRRIYQAITGGIEEGVTEFDVQLTESGENLQVICRWKYENTTSFKRHAPMCLERDTSPDAPTLVFDSLVQKTNLLEEEVKQGAAKYEGWKRLAEKEAGRVKEFVERKGDHDEEVRLKFAAVLAEKKGNDAMEVEGAAERRVVGDDEAGPSTAQGGYSSNETEASDDEEVDASSREGTEDEEEEDQ